MINVKVEAAFPIQHLTFNIRRSGFSLMEAVVSILIVSILLVAALTSVGAGAIPPASVGDIALCLNSLVSCSRLKS